MATLPAVLVTNDDGEDAPGIRALVAVLGAADFCRVYVCAPNVERSAVGHAITLRETLEARLVEDYAGATQAYSLTGTPADCASLGISGELCPKPDLVLSGINKGGNAGLSCIYSGTVAGAREAHMAGIPAISLSLDWGEASSDALFESGAQVCLPLIKAALAAAREGQFPRDYFLNVNIPVVPAQNKGFKLTRQSRSIVTITWSGVQRRTGHQLMSDLSMAAVAPPASGGRGPAPFPLPGMAGGTPVKLPGMSRAGAVALPGLGAPARDSPPLGLAQLGAAAAAKGAARKQGSESSANDEDSSTGEDPKKCLHFRHSVGRSWQAMENDPSIDLCALAQGFIAVTPLALLTAAPSPLEAGALAWLSKVVG